MYIQQAFLVNTEWSSDAQAFQVMGMDFSSFYNENQIRRMNKINKIGLFGALNCNRSSGDINFDAIVLGTGFGGADSSDQFLESIVMEKPKSPSLFIQSLHSTLTSHIAIALKCNGYTITHINKGAAFENVLTDSMLLLNESPDHQVLIGGVDILSEQKYNLVHSHTISKSLTAPETKIPKLGEGGAFFHLSSQSNAGSLGKILAHKSFLKNDSDMLKNEIKASLSKENISLSNLGILLGCESEDEETKEFFAPIMEQLEDINQLIYYKDYCGEFPTSTSFGMWLGTSREETPVSIDPEVSHILVINQFDQTYLSYVLIELIK
ncbi:beta-ketoacyl synthase chain length factor [Marivirga sp. S37H4]|uniref:Beta-ketoacyl synthase chain length factor n=1 Tax=Marivirga aurantiaca TaxID=2802615 RepID=A0A934WYP6_9BACT|nr:beta-ketoacyl synthase chain length factor [Marivirga aurantiaca]MBK6265312.1 beta-ketoacyl synthase chain length factor [Marivirga aurantiaca]